MHRRSVLFLLANALAGVSRLNAYQDAQTATQPEPQLTVEEIVRLTRAGVAEDLIIAKIKKNAKAFDLSTDELVDLKKYGVSETVVKFMLDPSQPYSPPAPTVAAKPAKKYPPDPFANRIPADPGLYSIASGAPALIDLKVFLGAEEPRGFMKKKGKTIAYLLGPSAKTRLKNPLPAFYLRMPEGKQIEELLLISFSPANGRRELDMGPSGPKAQFNPEDIHPFDSLEVGAQLYRLNVPRLAGGEYSFLFIGSAEPAKGIYGKGYDFGVDVPPQPTNKSAKKTGPD